MVAGIILITVAVRLIMMPLSYRAMRGQAVAARLAPELRALQQRYGKQPERLQREMKALYQREGASVFGAIGPVLLQWPFLSVLYLLFRSERIGGHANTLLAHDLLGVPLGSHWLAAAGPLSAHGAVFAGLFAVLAALCWLSGRLTRAQMETARPSPASAQVSAPVPLVPDLTSAPAAQGLMIRLVPYLSLLIAAFAPLAAGVYLVTTTAWSIVERRLFWRGPGGQAPAVRRGSAGQGRGADARARRQPSR